LRDLRKTLSYRRINHPSSDPAPPPRIALALDQALKLRNAPLSKRTESTPSTTPWTIQAPSSGPPSVGLDDDTHLAPGSGDLLYEGIRCMGTASGRGSAKEVNVWRGDCGDSVAVGQDQSGCFSCACFVVGALGWYFVLSYLRNTLRVLWYPTDIRRGGERRFSARKSILNTACSPAGPFSPEHC